MLATVLAHPLAPVACVAYDAPGTPLGLSSPGALHGSLGHQGGKHGGRMPLAWCEDERHELAVAVSPDVAFRADAAVTAAKRFRVWGPFFAPAACWCARTMVPST
jgi:hypothetical protein